MTNPHSRYCCGGLCFHLLAPLISQGEEVRRGKTVTFMLSFMSLWVRVQQLPFLQPQPAAAARQPRHCHGQVCRIISCSVQVSLPTAECVFLPLCSFLPCVYNRALLCQCESSSIHFSSGDTEDRSRKDPVPGGGVGTGDSHVLWW